MAGRSSPAPSNGQRGGKASSTTPANSRRPSAIASTPARSTTPAAAPAPRDITALITLPLKITLKGPDEAERKLEGSLWSFDDSTGWGVLATPASTSPSSEKGKGTFDYLVFHTSAIVSVACVSTMPTALPAAPTPLSAQSLQHKVQRAVQEDQRQRARVGKGVSEEAQKLFDALGRTLPVRWHERTIVVMDEVIIEEPYGVVNVKGQRGSNERVERVKKVVEGERQRMQWTGP